MDNEYLSQAVGGPLTQCLAELAEVKPKDPIEWISHWLYRYMDNELYFYDKSIFLKDLHRMQLELEREKARRQQRMNELNTKIKDIKTEVGLDIQSMSQVFKAKMRKSRGTKDGGGGGGGGYGYEDGDEQYMADGTTKRQKTFSKSSDYYRRHPSKLQEMLLNTDINEEYLRLHPELNDLVGSATWNLDCNLGLVCEHTILGEMRSRPPFIPPETPEWWEKQGYLEETLYDHEVYSSDNSDTIRAISGKNPLTYKDFVQPGPWLQEGSLRGMQESLQEVYRMDK